MGIQHLIILLMIFVGFFSLTEAYSDSAMILETGSLSYDAGELVIVRGLILDVDKLASSEVVIQVKDPNGDTILVKKLIPNANGVFSLQFYTTGVLWESAGAYEVTAKYGDIQSSKTFEFGGGGFFVPVRSASISTDSDSYSQHDTVKITGYLRDYFEQFPFDEQSTEIIPSYQPATLSLIINGPDGRLVILDTFTPRVDGSFEKNYLLAGLRWIEAGEYTVGVRYENKLHADTSFSFSGGDGSYPGDLWPQVSHDKDTVPPILITPSDFVVDAVDVSGTRVKYSISAIDDRDGKSATFCIPSSGRNFPVGDNLVSCFAADAAGNSIKKTFTITVKEPETKDWVKIAAKKWCNEEISDMRFFNEIEFLVDDKIIDSAAQTVQEIPDWIKTTACWWGDDIISDKEFIKGLEFTIQRGLVPRSLFG